MFFMEMQSTVDALHIKSHRTLFRFFPGIVGAHPEAFYFTVCLFFASVTVVAVWFHAFLHGH